MLSFSILNALFFFTSMFSLMSLNLQSEYRSVQARVTFASAYTAKNVYFQVDCFSLILKFFITIIFFGTKIRAANTYVSGNWSESISIVITPSKFTQ